MKYYLRVENNNFGFIVDEVHEINIKDKVITTDEYNRFFELQSQGKQFRVKEKILGNGLFDIIEEFEPDLGVLPPSDKARLEAIEKLMLEVL